MLKKTCTHGKIQYMGTLFIVSTPIGNLKDLTIRASEILSNVEYIACEDTRRTGTLLIQLPNVVRKAHLISYYEQNEIQRIPQIIGILKNGIDVALISDAGTPTISDPGFKLVRQSIVEGIKVESIPGPSSVLTALTVSGLPTDKFLFIGYLPRKEGHRKTLLEDIKNQTVKATIIMFEAPHRLVKTLTEMQEMFGDIDIVVCRELTKLHEEVRREKISQAIEYFAKVTPKGEFVILFHL